MAFACYINFEESHIRTPGSFIHGLINAWHMIYTRAHYHDFKGMLEKVRTPSSQGREGIVHGEAQHVGVEGYLVRPRWP